MSGEVEALARSAWPDLAPYDALARASDVLDSDWLAVDRAAAEARGAEAVLNAVEDMVAGWSEAVPPAAAISILRAACATAVVVGTSEGERA